MRKKIIDERINNMELKIAQFMYRILKIFLALSILFQMFILNVAISNYIVETIALISISILEFIAYSKNGILNDGKKRKLYKKTFRNVIISTIFLSIMYIFIVRVDDYRQFLIMILVYVILYTSFNIVINLYNCNSLDAINNKINEYDD